MTKYTLAQLQQPDNKLILIDGSVYDVEDFVSVHPGGKVIETYMTGQDASIAFNAFHPPEAHEVLANYYVGDLIDGDGGLENATQSIDKIRQDSKLQDRLFAQEIEALRQAYVKNGKFDSSKMYYAVKLITIAGLIALSVYVLQRDPTSVVNVMLSASILGLMWQQSGWLSHDFLHNQVSKNRVINKAFGYLVGNVVQGFSVRWWQNKHNTHHAHPNIHSIDPDVDTMPILGWSKHAIIDYLNELGERQHKQQSLSPDATPTEKASAFVRYMLYNQGYLYFVILAFARLSWAYSSVMYNFEETDFGFVRSLELATLSLHWLLYGSFMFWCIPSVLLIVLYVLTSQCVSGLLLSFVFSLNHNGMPIYTTSEADGMSFYKLQVLTGRNVYPNWFSTWFTGGLNYQIEHHLFPSMPRHRLPEVSDQIRRLCSKFNVPYHVTSFKEGTSEVIGRLHQVGNVAQMLINANE